MTPIRKNIPRPNDEQNEHDSSFPSAHGNFSKQVLNPLCIITEMTAVLQQWAYHSHFTHKETKAQRVMISQVIHAAERAPESSTIF